MPKNSETGKFGTIILFSIIITFIFITYLFSQATIKLNDLEKEVLFIGRDYHSSLERSSSERERRILVKKLEETGISDLTVYSEDILAAYESLMEHLNRRESESLKNIDENFRTLSRALEDQNRDIRKSFVFMLWAAGILMSLTTLIILFQDRRISRIEWEARTQEELEKLRLTIYRGEVNKIAQELHDGTAQNLAYLKLLGEQTDDPRIGETAAHALNEVRHMIEGLRQTGREDEKTLQDLMRSLQTELPGRYSLNVEIKLESPLEGDFDDPPSLYQLRRIIVECASNSVRHGISTEFTITIRGEKENVILRCSDNGTGLEDYSKGYGMRGIEERVKLLQGSVTWEKQERGTAVCFRFPYRDST